MVSLSCLSMISPVGYTPQSAAAALRAGISAFRELPYRHRDGDNIMGAMVPAVAVETRGRERLMALAHLVFETLPQEFIESLPWDHMPLLLCLPETQRPGPRSKEIVSNLSLGNGKALRPSQILCIEGGSTAAFQAIEQARQMLATTSIPACLILAIDSLIDARVLAWLDADYRLKTSEQTDGVIPGEAGCLIIVGRTPIARTSVTLCGIGLAQEMATVRNEEPFLGKGLASALRMALAEAEIEMHQVDFRISDVAGESYAFEELVLAQTRLMRQVRSSQPLWHPADCIGDCGAATGLIQFAWAEQAFARDYAPGDIVALHGSSAFGARATAVLKPSQKSVRHGS